MTTENTSSRRRRRRPTTTLPSSPSPSSPSPSSPASSTTPPPRTDRSRPADRSSRRPSPSPRGPSSTRTGTVRLNPRGFGFCDLDALDWPSGPLEALTSCFVPPPLLDHVCDGDLVTATVTLDPDGRGTAQAIEVMARSRRELVGIVASDGRLIPDPFAAAGRFTLSPSQGETLAPGTAVRVILEDTPRGRGATVIESFASPVALDALRARALSRRMLPHEPPADQLPSRTSITAAISGHGPGRPPRRDLRHLTTITIDADHSRDLDDALSTLGADPDGGVRVLVHIADVAEHVEVDSALDLAAREVSTSIYLPGFTRPMLPAHLSEDALSLVPETDRKVLTVELRIRPDGSVAPADIFESAIRSDMRINYEHAADVLAGQPGAEVAAEIAELLGWLRCAAARLSQARAARGGVSSIRVEPELALWMDGDTPNMVAASASNEAHLLIERLMVAANEAVARWLVDRGLPGLYRNHPGPNAEGIAELEAFATALGYRTAFGDTVTPAVLAALEAQIATSLDPASAALADLLLGSMGRANYAPTPSGHFALGSKAYLHFTSPLRRYADLTVHRIVKAYLHGNRGAEAFPDPQALESLAAHINDASSRAARAERDVDQMCWALALQAEHGPLSGRVTAITPRGVRITLDRSQVRGFATMRDLPGGWLEPSDDGQAVVTRSGTVAYRIGQDVTVTAARIDVVTGSIDLEVVDPRRSGDARS